MHSHDLHPTPRQLAVLNLICEGYSTKQIASFLGIAFKTAAAHRAHLMDKAGASNVIVLFRWALRNGYVTVNCDRSDARHDSDREIAQSQSAEFQA